MEFRLLKADEIECRAASVSMSRTGNVGCSLLLYKDARVDMNLLDETVGIQNWTRKHDIVGSSLYCTVGVYIEARNEWVYKQDVGVESYTEKEKGQASDSFKRACFNWGIGRELYTAPFIWVSLDENEYYVKEKKDTKNIYALSGGTAFHVLEIDYNDKREIIKLVIVDNKGKVRYRLGLAPQAQEPSNVAPDNTPVSEIDQPKESPKEEPKAADKPVKVISKAQVNRLYAIAKKKGYSSDEVNTCIFKKLGKRTVDLIKSEYDEVVKGYEECKTKEELEAAKAAKGAH